MPDADTHPRACVQKGWKERTQDDRYAEHPGIPCAMVHGLYAPSPVSGLFSHRRASRSSRQRLTSASGGQDHTISLVRAGLHSSYASQPVHRTPPHVS
jgi:hypothetical protein